MFRTKLNVFKKDLIHRNHAEASNLYQNSLTTPNNEQNQCRIRVHDPEKPRVNVLCLNATFSNKGLIHRNHEVGPYYVRAV